jgi:hypothetical protein
VPCVMTSIWASVSNCFRLSREPILAFPFVARPCWSLMFVGIAAKGKFYSVAEQIWRPSG